MDIFTALCIEKSLQCSDCNCADGVHTLVKGMYIVSIEHYKMLLDTSTHIVCFHHLKKTHMQLNIDQLSQLLHKFCKMSSQLMWLTTIGTNDHKMPLQEMDQALLIFHYLTPSWFQRIQKFLRYQVHRSTQVPVLAPEPRNAELVLIWIPGKYGILCQG
jgi:hypothetical protein